MKRMNKIMTLFLVGLLIAMTACTSSGEKKGTEKSALLVIPSTEVQDHELMETQRILEESGVLVTTVSVEGESVSGMLGGTFTPDMKLSDVNEADFDAIVCIGGNGSFGLWENGELISLINQFQQNGKLVSAICAASGILANAGVLDGIQATCFPYEPISDLLISKGADYIDQTVVISGNIITGNGPDASTSFGEALSEALKG